MRGRGTDEIAHWPTGFVRQKCRECRQQCDTQSTVKVIRAGENGGETRGALGGHRDERPCGEERLAAARVPLQGIYAERSEERGNDLIDGQCERGNTSVSSVQMV